MIRCIIFDIDGVITDGRINVDNIGSERKNLNFKDIDAIYSLKEKGYKIIAITGESEDKNKYFKEKIPWDMYYAGIKNKLDVIKKIEKDLSIDRNNICYIGDGKYDIDSLKYVGLSICPKDAIEEVKKVSKYILSKDAGMGGLAEINKYIYLYENLSEFAIWFNEKTEQHINIFKEMSRNTSLIEKIEDISKIIFNAISNGNKVYIFGNGGSAADAQHIAAEFVGKYKFQRQAMNVEALVTNVSILTSIANDIAFEKIFTRQLEAKLQKNDVVIGISTSGKSVNVIDALKFSKSKEAKTIMLTGNFFNKEFVEKYCDYIIDVPSNDTPRIQESHIFIGHMIAEYVENKIVKNN